MTLSLDRPVWKSNSAPASRPTRKQEVFFLAESFCSTESTCTAGHMEQSTASGTVRAQRSATSAGHAKFSKDNRINRIFPVAHLRQDDSSISSYSRDVCNIVCVADRLSAEQDPAGPTAFCPPCRPAKVSCVCFTACNEQYPAAMPPSPSDAQGVEGHDAFSQLEFVLHLKDLTI